MSNRLFYEVDDMTSLGSQDLRDSDEFAGASRDIANLVGDAQAGSQDSSRLSGAFTTFLEVSEMTYHAYGRGAEALGMNTRGAGAANAESEADGASIFHSAGDRAV